MSEIIKPITLSIDNKLWEDFKKFVPRSMTLNDSIVVLITDYVKNRNNAKNENENKNQ